jgi:hypothetical protein
MVFEEESADYAYNLQLTMNLETSHHTTKMHSVVHITAILSTLFTPTPAPSAQACTHIEPLSNLNVSEFSRSTWYIQKQQITGYQSESELYCVAQTLNDEPRTVPFFTGPVLSVYNYANYQRPNGPPLNMKNGTVLCARITNENNTGAIINAPCFLPNILAGPYWVIAAGPKQTNYEWAIISGGPPTAKQPDGNCTTKTTGTNGSGLWLFTRSPADVHNYTKNMLGILREKGYSTALLLNVDQSNCSYHGAFIKQ